MLKLFAVHCQDKTKSKQTARRLLAFAAYKVWGWDELPPMERGERGKPFFPDYPHCQFNLSHSGNYAFCALSDEGAVGVDVELVWPRRGSLPAYVLSEQELAEFDGSWEDFTRLWTIKEAHVKYLGGSIWSPKQVSVHPPVALATFAGEGWRGALCSEVPLQSDIIWVDESNL